MGKDLLSEMDKGFKLDFSNNRHREALSKLINPNIKKIKAFVAKPVEGQRMQIKGEVAKCERILDDVLNDRGD